MIVCWSQNPLSDLLLLFFKNKALVCWRTGTEDRCVDPSIYLVFFQRASEIELLQNHRASICWCTGSDDRFVDPSIHLVICFFSSGKRESNHRHCHRVSEEESQSSSVWDLYCLLVSARSPETSVVGTDFRWRPKILKQLHITHTLHYIWMNGLSRLGTRTSLAS
jgi:hypothetical protein